MNFFLRQAAFLDELPLGMILYIKIWEGAVQMKKNRIYFKLGLTLLCVVLCSVVFQVIFSNLSGFFQAINSLLAILSPILYGVLFAYLMNPVMEFIKGLLLRGLKRWPKTAQMDPAQLRSWHQVCHVIGVVFSILTMLLFFYLAIGLIVPTIIENISSIFNQETIIDYYTRIINWMHQLLSDQPEIENWAIAKVQDLYDFALTWLAELDLREALLSLTTQVFGVLKGTMDFLLGLVIAVYMLLCKEKFLAQAKKLVVALFSEKRANRLLELGRRTNRIFGGFVMGKIIDSLIIGIICYIVMSIAKLPYPMLISVIIGVTNVIPFFGPFIGAIPSAVLILLINPIQCFVFVVFIVILQQFDGNILGPRILGDSVGLSSFWILISITLFSGFFGFAGMVLGVPVFAVLYMLLSDYVTRRLKEKGRPLSTEVYGRIRSTEDIELAQKMAEVAAERIAFHEDDPEAYEDEPEIEDWAE